MKTILIGCLLSLLALVLIPAGPQPDEQPDTAHEQVLLISHEQKGTAAADEQPEFVQTSDTPCGSDASTLRLLCDGQIQSLGVEEYLTGVVLCEMPVTFEMEALKAQAVAARTFLWKQANAHKHDAADICADSACCQAWSSADVLREKFGADYETACATARQAVAQTHDEVLTYQGELIDATYFSCSGGSTESALAVWGTDVPYLQPVQSPGEQEATRYASSCFVPAEQFRAAILQADAQSSLTGTPQTWLGEVKNTEGGGVESVKIGGVSFTGVQLRQMFGLNSTKFTMQADADGVTFDVLGFGHRVGMSQYGADNLARNGFSYRVILQYYYQHVRIKKLSRADSGQYLLSDLD